jgi:hypothetical protein
MPKRPETPQELWAALHPRERRQLQVGHFIYLRLRGIVLIERSPLPGRRYEPNAITAVRAKGEFAPEGRRTEFAKQALAWGRLHDPTGLAEEDATET